MTVENADESAVMDGLHLLRLSSHAPGRAGPRRIVAPTALANDDCLHRLLAGSSKTACRPPLFRRLRDSCLPTDRRKDAGAL
jgi:hypothetical protein